MDQHKETVQEELTKSNIKKDDKSTNTDNTFIERRKGNSSKSPPNPFMSRINISSFLNFMVSDKDNYNTKKYRSESIHINSQGRKNPKENISGSAMAVTGIQHGNVGDIGGCISSSAGAGAGCINLSNQCPVCANELSPSLMNCYTNCNHYACVDCWQAYVINRIENYEITFGFTCLTCTSELSYYNVVNIIKQINDIDYNKRLQQKLETFLLERALQQDQNYRRCPNPGCEFAFYLIPDYTGCKELTKCQLRPGCRGHLCGGLCGNFWVTSPANHDCKYQPTTSAAATGIQQIKKSDLITEPSLQPPPPPSDPFEFITEQRQPRWLTACFPWLRNRRRKRSGKKRNKYSETGNGVAGSSASPSKLPMNQTEPYDNVSLESFKSTSSRNKMNKSSEQGEGEIKTCPKCHTFVLKMNDGSCNHMVCVICGCEFCWLCMRQITDMHYLSPSGCTFWGRRQWNVEKRALWQLGTLIGAPIAIGFLAALAIPAMVIGIPLYVGRKIHGALKTKNKEEKRTVAILGGLGAFIISPVVAAIAVGLGVPLILAYVYVVMPIALCRASACSCDDNAKSPQEGLYFNNADDRPSPDPFSSFIASDVKGDLDSQAISSHTPVITNKPLIHVQSDVIKTSKSFEKGEEKEVVRFIPAHEERVLIGDRTVSQSASELNYRRPDKHRYKQQFYRRSSSPEHDKRVIESLHNVNLCSDKLHPVPPTSQFSLADASSIINPEIRCAGSVNDINKESTEIRITTSHDNESSLAEDNKKSTTSEK